MRLYIRLVIIVFLMTLVFQLCGCGETVQGVSRDWRRVGKGVKTIFIRDTE